MTYDNFCEAAVHVGRETAMSIENKCEGWYTASKAILAPAIEEKNRLRHKLQERNCLTATEFDQLQQQLKNITKRNRDLVKLMLVQWNTHQHP